jgi:hypothetical protein
LSSFKDTANEHISQIQELIAILENHEVYVKTLKTKRGWKRFPLRPNNWSCTFSTGKVGSIH